MMHWFILLFMLTWMFMPLAIYGFSPRKNRDPYLWVFASAILGPIVGLVFFVLPPAKPQAA